MRSTTRTDPAGGGTAPWPWIGSNAVRSSDPLTTFTTVVDVDLVSVYALSELVVGSMAERGGGSIVNISSVFGLVAGPRWTTAATAPARRR